MKVPFLVVVKGNKIGRIGKELEIVKVVGMARRTGTEKEKTHGARVACSGVLTPGWVEVRRKEDGKFPEPILKEVVEDHVKKVGSYIMVNAYHHAKEKELEFGVAWKGMV